MSFYKELSFSMALSPEKAAEYLETIADGMRKGKLFFSRNDDSLTLKIQGGLALEIKARIKGVRNKVGLEIRWWSDTEETKNPVISAEGGKKGGRPGE